MKQKSMVKRYFIAIFLLSVASLNGMDDGKKAIAEQERIDVTYDADHNEIEAMVSIPWRSGTCTHSVTTFVIKDRNSDSFKVRAELCPSAEYGIPLIFITAEPETVKRLKAKIAEFENKK